MAKSLSSRHSISAPDLEKLAAKLIAKGRNILVEGTHGTGKTSILRKVVSDLGLNCKYYSASTLDPFADLVGIPVPVELDGKRLLVYHQPQDLTDCDVLYFDELNRSHQKVQNAVMELVQFKSLNGIPLPKLKCVIASINPSDGDYHTFPLDPALKGRFIVHVQMQSSPTKSWFKKMYGRIGEAACNWWLNDLNEVQRAICDPRTLESLCILIGDKINPTGLVMRLHNHPIERLLESVSMVNDTLPDITDFVNNPNDYAELLETDIEIATRFKDVTEVMKDDELYKTRLLFMCLPNELLITALTKKLVNRLHDMLIMKDGLKEADMFIAMLKDRCSETIKTT